MGFIDDGKYSWEEIYANIKEVIGQIIRGKNRDRKDIYEILSMSKEFMKDIIHNKLYENRSVGDNESKIREICRYVILVVLPYLNREIMEIDREIKNRNNNEGKKYELALEMERYLDLEDDYYAIASFRSLIHYAHYMERQDDKSQLVWKYNMGDTMGGVFYYSNQMILDYKYKSMVKQCPTGYGKCLHRDTLVGTPKGNVKIKDLNIGDRVYSMKDNEIVVRKVLNKWETNKKQVKIKTRSGREIITSPEHKMYTQKGYVMAKDLSIGDYFYTQLNKINGENVINSDELCFITGMIFEGSCTHNTINFTQEENEFKDYFLRSCEKLGLSYGETEKKNCKAKSYWFRTKDKKVVELLKKYDIYECNSHTKRLSNKILTMPLKQKYEFISYMLSTDGYIPKYNGNSLIGVALANEMLINDIQSLLSSCGIYSKKSYKKIKLGDKTFDSWRLEIPDEYVEILYNNCYCFHKQSRLEERYNKIKNKNINSYCNRVNYPKEILANCKEFKKENNKQWARNKTFKREKVEEFNERTYLLDDIVYKDFVYDEIVYIENINEYTDMIDIEVEETHNFIANGFVSHNSKSDCVIISFCFGYDPNDDIMKVVGNRNLVKPITQSITKMLKSKRFSKVFPVYAKYNNDNSIFKNCAETDGTFTLSESKKSLSFACYNKDTAIDGGRFNKQFYDDVTQSNDRENVNAHLKDRGKYDSQWKKRQYDEFSCLRWFTGTAYHSEDFLSYIKKYLSNGKELINEPSTKGNKWNKFVKTNQEKDAIFVSVPKLADLELGEDKCYCTFPQKYSKYEALKELHSSDTAIRRFMAMEQQQPLPPESLGFDWAYLQQYETLPKDVIINNCDTILVIDPSRRGGDNYAGLIFKRPENEDKWYLVDCYYKKVSSKVAIPKICERATHHKVQYIYFESNTVDVYQMEQEIKRQMANFGWNEYMVKNFYSTRNKEEKISYYRDDIREKIVFPKRGMYHEDSDMGRALRDITAYSFSTKNTNDDSIDCCAMLMVVTTKKVENTIQALNFHL